MQDLEFRTERVWPLPGGGSVKVEVRSGAPIAEGEWPILAREAAVADAGALIKAWEWAWGMPWQRLAVLRPAT